MSKAIREPATGKRVSKQFDTKDQAEAYEKLCAAALEDGDQYLPAVDTLHRDRSIRAIAAATLATRYGHKPANSRKQAEFQFARIGKHFGWDADFSVAINKYTASEYIAAMEDYAPASRNVARSAINVLVSEAAELGLIRPFHLPPEDVNNRKEYYLSKEEEDRLLAALNPKYKGITRFTILTGLRLFEALKVSMDDIQGRSLKVIGKGNKRRQVPLTDEAMHLLEKHGGFANKFERAALQTGIRVAARKCNLPVTFHTLRHTTASRLAIKGAHPTMIQKLLGHSSLNTTMAYMHLAPDWGDEVRHLLD